MAIPQIQGMDTDYKPWGGLAGIMTGERQALQEAANLQGLEESQLSNILKRVEASRAQNDFDNPEMERWRQAKEMGMGMQQDAAGRLKQGTLDTDISSGVSKNIATTSGSKIDNMINLLDNSLAMLESNGPAGMSMVMTQFPPELQQLMQQAGPNAPQFLSKFSEMLKQQRMQTPKYMGDVALEDRKSENDFIIKDMEQTAATSRNDADNRARSADRAAQLEIAKETKATADKARLEDQLTRRIAVLNSEFKANETELKRVSEELSMVGSMPLIGMTKPEKEKERTRMRTALEAEKSSITAEQSRLRREARRIAELSSFKDKGTTEPKQEAASPSLPPGVLIVK